MLPTNGDVYQVCTLHYCDSLSATSCLRPLGTDKLAPLPGQTALFGTVLHFQGTSIPEQDVSQPLPHSPTISVLDGHDAQQAVRNKVIPEQAVSHVVQCGAVLPLPFFTAYFVFATLKIKNKNQKKFSQKIIRHSPRAHACNKTTRWLDLDKTVDITPPPH